MGSLQIGQDEIHVELPRTMLGGLKEGPVEDLLRRIARDYAKLELENQRLWKTVEQLESSSGNAAVPGDEPAASTANPAPTEPPAALAVSEAAEPMQAITPVDPARTPEPAPRVQHAAPYETAAPHETLGSRQPFWFSQPSAAEQEEAAREPDLQPGAPTRHGVVDPGVVDPKVSLPAPGPIEAEQRSNPDELVSAVLSVAHRAAREMRESARSECELMIRKTRAHARKLERELDRSRAATSAEIEELHALKVELREHMRSSLQALLRTFVLERAGEMPALDWGEQAGFVFSVGEKDSSERSNKHSKSKS